MAQSGVRDDRATIGEAVCPYCGVGCRLWAEAAYGTVLRVKGCPEAPANLATRVARLLSDWTGRHWMVSLVQDAGEPTLYEQELEQKVRRHQDAQALPLVQHLIAERGLTDEEIDELQEMLDRLKGRKK